MKQLIAILALAVAVLLLSACAEGGDTREAIPADGTYAVLEIPSLAYLWDGVDQVIGELRQQSPELAEEIIAYFRDALEELRKTTGLTPGINSIEDIQASGIDATLPISVVLSGVLDPTKTFIIPLQDPLRFPNWLEEVGAGGESEVVEEYRGVEIYKGEDGSYSAFEDGVLILGDRRSFIRDCLDARHGEGERFFDQEVFALLSDKLSLHQLACYIDTPAIMKRLQPFLGLHPLGELFGERAGEIGPLAGGLRVSPDGILLTGLEYTADAPKETVETAPPIPAEALLFAELPIPASDRQLFMESARYYLNDMGNDPDLRAVIDTIGAENLLTFLSQLGSNSFIYLLDNGELPQFTLAIDLLDSTALREIFDSTYLPLINDALTELFRTIRLVREENGEQLTYRLQVDGMARLNLSPAFVFTKDHLLVTTNTAAIEQIEQLQQNTAGGIEENPDYQLFKKLLPSHRLSAMFSLDKVVEILSVTPGVELPAVVRIVASRYPMLGMGTGTEENLRCSSVLLASRNYHPGASLDRTEVHGRVAWWVWLYGGIGLGTLVVFFVLFLLLRRLIRHRRSVNGD